MRTATKVAIGIAVLLGGAALASASSGSSPSGPPTLVGLSPGAAYRVTFRSSLSQTTFGDAEFLHAQTLLGRQGLNVVAVNPNANGDPYDYDALGIYQGTTGHMQDDPEGIELLSAEAIPASSLPLPALDYVTARPVPLVPGTTYAGRASLPFPVDLLISAADVTDKLKQQGFTDVIAYTSAEDLPSDWPPTERGGDVFAIATYPVTANAKTMSVPSQVRSIWKVPT